MPNRKPQKQQLDLSYARAATLLLPAHDRLRLVLVGCGGTGSWLAPSVARIARILRDQNRQVEVLFYDHDTVEPKNIPRQNFCEAELGRNKAVTLAARFSAAWGVEISAVPTKFTARALGANQYGTLTIFLGCVDNAAARKEISVRLERNSLGFSGDDLGFRWWLDCGNGESSGQVIVGSAVEPKGLAAAFTSSCKICKALPAPAIVAPDLLQARPEELLAEKLSCAEIQLANTQSLAVNQQVAAIATDYLLRLLGGSLKKFATYFDLESGSARSRYITVEEVASVIRKRPEYLIALKTKK
jgi:PRTRC genetic system ThiF family protein